MPFEPTPEVRPSHHQPAACQSARRPFVPSPPSGPYRLPPAVLDRLQRDLARFRNRDAAMALAVFLGRFWSVPGRVALAFPIDRRALCRHPALGLSEDRVRGALATLERVGFVVREIARPGQRYQRKGDTLHRRPIAFRFGPDSMGDFLAANAMRKVARQRRPTAAQGRSRALPHPTPSSLRLPSTPVPASSPKVSPSSPRDSSFRIALSLGEQALPVLPTPIARREDAGLEAAIQRLQAARAPTQSTSGSR